MTTTTKDQNDLKETVRERYGAAARSAAAGVGASCCGPAPSETASGCCEPTAAPTACCGTDSETDPITSDLYTDGETSGLPEGAVLASLGCGNPTALAELAEGETVLDLGSGGGIDVLLSAKRVGPTGKAYGLDMTDDMLALARHNQAQAGVDNVEFLKGEIESIPLPDNSVDVIISNCVINLSGDKPTVLSEAFRVLKPGGRFAVSDIVVKGDMDERIRERVDLWTGCVAGALEEGEYARLLASAGFADIGIEPTRVYEEEDTVALISTEDPETVELARQAAGKFMSAFVRATKPA